MSDSMPQINALLDQLRVSALVDDWETFDSVLAEVRAYAEQERSGLRAAQHGARDRDGHRACVVAR